MKYYGIKEKLSKEIIFSVEDIFIIDPEFRRQTLYDWEKEGKVIKLRNQRYIFADNKPSDTDLYTVANKLYSPSYVSLELALNHYGIIPEAVLEITSITTNKTMRFKTALGNFSYGTIKPNLFFGYTLVQDHDHVYKIASIEKAILDYLYLNNNVASIEDFEALRFNKEAINGRISMETMGSYAKIFDSIALNQRIESLYRYVKI